MTLHRPAGGRGVELNVFEQKTKHEENLLRKCFCSGRFFSKL